MTHVTESRPGRMTAFGLVRDANGKPKIDDIFNIPEPIWNLLTEDEQQEIENVRNTSRNNP